MLEQNLASTMFTKVVWRSAAGFILLGWLAGHGAWAAALPAPTADAYEYVGDESEGGGGVPPRVALLDFPGLGVGCAAAVGDGFSSVCGIPANPAGPAVAVTLTGAEMNTEAGESYNVQIVGPVGVPVPLIVEGNVYTKVAGFDTSAILYTDAYELINGPGDSVLLYADACSSFEQGLAGGGCTPSVMPSVLINDTIMVQSNDILGVTLSATATAVYGSSLDNFAAAFADPSFEIDPTFPLSDEFSINISPGIGNPISTTSSVPEPNTLALLGTAFGACLLYSRRWRSEVSHRQFAERAAGMYR
jgi:hypothetical protein